MTYKQFQDWLDNIFTAWKTKNPQQAVAQCAEKVIWFETPFSKALTTKEELLKEWQGILNQEDISISYKVLSVTETFGLALWKAKCTLLSTKQKMMYEGIYQVSLNEKGHCTEFREWFNSKVI